MIWVTGLPNSGKTTFAYSLADQLRSLTKLTPVVLDGDDLRNCLSPLMTSADSYSTPYREKLSHCYARFGIALEQQGFCSIVSTVSFTSSIWDYNRHHDPRYFEIYLQDDFQLVKSRDQRSIYHDLNPTQIEEKYSHLPRPINPTIKIDPVEPERQLSSIIKSILTIYQ